MAQLPFTFVNTTSINGRHVQADFDALAKAISEFELLLSFAAGNINNFKELTYSGSDLTNVSIYTDATKASKLFNKDLTYTGSNLTKVVTTNTSNGQVLTKVLAYTGSQLSTVTQVLS